MGAAGLQRRLLEGEVGVKPQAERGVEGGLAGSTSETGMTTTSSFSSTFLTVAQSDGITPGNLRGAHIYLLGLAGEENPGLIAALRQGGPWSSPWSAQRRGELPRRDTAIWNIRPPVAVPLASCDFTEFAPGTWCSATSRGAGFTPR